MDGEVLPLLKKAGFDQIFVGVESGSDAVLKRIKKDITVEQVLLADSKLKKAGIKPFYSFMAGFPLESMDDVKRTLRLMNQLLRRNPDAIVYKLQMFTPFPGTELLHLSSQLGTKFPSSLAGWSNYHYDTINHGGFLTKHKKFLQDFHFYTEFLDTKLSRERSWPLKRIASLFSAILNFRLEHDLYSFLYEVDVLKIGKKIRKRLLSRC
jgi:hypothetical protein